jgi:hypothetical protein
VGGFLGIGQSKGEKQGMGQLSNVFNFALPLAQQQSGAGQKTTASGLDTTKAGLSTLGGPLAYWQKLMSGNRAAMNQAVAPEANAARSASDATARQTAATGTARGGGTAGTSQQRQTDLNAQIDNLLFGVRPEAAKQTADIGKTQADIGLDTAQIGNQQLQQALAALGIGTQAGGATTSAALNKEQMGTDVFNNAVRALI